MISPCAAAMRFEQPLQRAVLEHPEAVRRQDRAVHDIAKACGVVFALHQQGLFHFQHLCPPGQRQLTQRLLH